MLSRPSSSRAGTPAPPALTRFSSSTKEWPRPSLGRQGLGIFEAGRNPLGQRRRRRQPLGLYENPSLHGTAPRQVEHARVPFGERPVGVRRVEAYEHLLTVHAAAHVAIHEEGEAAEHPLLGHASALGEAFANACGQFLIERHRVGTRDRRCEVSSSGPRLNCWPTALAATTACASRPPRLSCLTRH